MFAAIESDVCLAFDRCEVCNAAAAVDITVTDGPRQVTPVTQSHTWPSPLPYNALQELNFLFLQLHTLTLDADRRCRQDRDLAEQHWCKVMQKARQCGCHKLTSALRRLLVDETHVASEIVPINAQNTLSCQFSKCTS